MGQFMYKMDHIDPVSLQIETESSQNQAMNLASNHLKIVLNETEYEFPHLGAAFSDYDKSATVHIPLATDIFDYYHKIDPNRPITRLDVQQIIRDKFTDIVNTHNPGMPSINFEHDGNVLIPQDRQAIHALQQELPTPFICDVELDRNQELRHLTQQLTLLDNFNSEKIKCPTISIRCKDSANFEEKLEYIIKKYKRFNLEWGGFGTHDKNWYTLSRLLFGRKIWCHVFGISPKHTAEAIVRNQERLNILKSSIFLSMSYGAHTFSFGYPKMYEQYIPMPRLFNRNTLCYDDVDMNNNEANCRSFNLIQEELIVASIHIRNDTFYSQYCRDKHALHGFIQN